jgi:hypothetical protein
LVRPNMKESFSLGCRARHERNRQDRIVRE